jgi:hypothetical protein
MNKRNAENRERRYQPFPAFDQMAHDKQQGTNSARLVVCIL